MMRPITREICHFIAQAVGSSLPGAVGPQVGTPAEPEGFDVSFGRVIIQFRVASQLIFNQPFHGKTGFVGIRLGIQTCGSKASISPTGKIAQFRIGKPVRYDLNDL